MSGPTRRKVATLCVLAAALALTACSGEEASPSGSTIGPGTTIATGGADASGTGPLDYPAYRDAAAPIYVALSRRFALQLDSEPGTGSSWQVANTPDPAIVVPLGTQFRSTNPGVLGAPATQYISFAAAGIGTTTIEVRYLSPTGEPVPDTDPVTFTVTVTFTGEPPPPPPPEPGTTLPLD